MEAIIIPEGTIATIRGVEVFLVTSVIVEVPYNEMSRLRGYHYAHIETSEDPEGV